LLKLSMDIIPKGVTQWYSTQVDSQPDTMLVFYIPVQKPEN